MFKTKYFFLCLAILPFLFGCQTGKGLRGDRLVIRRLESRANGFFITVINPSTKPREVIPLDLAISLRDAHFRDTNGFHWNFKMDAGHPIPSDDLLNTIFLRGRSTNVIDISKFVLDPPFELMNSELIPKKREIPSEILAFGVVRLLFSDDEVVVGGHFFDMK